MQSSMRPEKISIMEITNKQIETIEKVLLPQGCSFDDERRAFIKCMESRDVNACAGSGKTTALIAKLMILDRFHMPFENNKGICVLTHTNVAIDEVKERLGANSQLLNYPNFFGTIQSFVDKFLAVPYYVQSYKNKPKYIDSDIYEERLEDKLKMCLRGQKRIIFNKVALIKNVNPKLLINYRFDFSGEDLVLKKVFKGSELVIAKPKGRSKVYVDWSDEEKNCVRSYLKALKTQLFKEGILHFEDAYLLAERYLCKYEPQLKNLFANRFKFVFIDEMQDSYQHQINIFDKIFDKDRIIYQCIGDPNQAIYNSANSNLVWHPLNPLSISNSKRFSTSIANVISNIRLRGVDVDLIGNPKKQVLRKNGISGELFSYIILFEDSQIRNVVEKFKELIVEYKLHIPSTTNQSAKKIKFKAIGWVGADKDKETSTGQIKHCIKHYFEENLYKKESKMKDTFDNLSDYLLRTSKDEKKYQSSRQYKDALTNAFLKVLRLSGVKQENDKYYTPTTFWRKIYEDEVFSNTFRLKIINWSKNIIQENAIVEDVKQFVKNELKDFFEYQVSDDLNIFLDNQPKLNGVDNQKVNNYLEFESDGVKFKIDIATIHSVKGETHTGTLYLETAYYGYETNKVRGRSTDNTFLQLLKGGSRNGEFNNRIIETLKMAYVGMSRPTHLLCVALHKTSFDNLQQDIQDLESAGWRVIDL